jgi:hypothetical protein
MEVALQFVGALGILVPFALFQKGVLSQHAYTYLALNVAGSGVLTAVASLDRQWGFVILQGVWAIVSGVSIGRKALAPTARSR